MSLEIEELELVASANIEAIRKWIADGEPYEEHEENLMYKELERINGIPESKSIDYILVTLINKLS